MWKCADKVRLGGWKNGQRPKIVCIRPPTSIHTFSPTKKTFYPHLASQHRWLSTTKADDYKVKVKGAKKNDEKKHFQEFLFWKSLPYLCRGFRKNLQQKLLRNEPNEALFNPQKTLTRKDLKALKISLFDKRLPSNTLRLNAPLRAPTKCHFSDNEKPRIVRRERDKSFPKRKTLTNEIAKKFSHFLKKNLLKKPLKSSKTLAILHIASPT